MRPNGGVPEEVPDLGVTPLSMSNPALMCLKSFKEEILIRFLCLATRLAPILHQRCQA